MFQLPAALAGDDNEVEASTDGASKIVGLTGGVALGVGIVTVGVLAARRGIDAVTGTDPVGDLY